MEAKYVHKSFKSSNFLNTIDKYAKRQKSKITDEIKEIEKRELEKAEAEIMEDVNSMIQKELIGMKNKIVALLNRLPKATTIPANEKSKTGTNIAAPNLCSFCIIIHSPHKKKDLLNYQINKSSFNKFLSIKFLF